VVGGGGFREDMRGKLEGEPEIRAQRDESGGRNLGGGSEAL